ncbi:MAG: hypothetical protein IIW48_03015 [Clostridia bacterium]|nr:hypothetical protein [Clostridia bacterium]
MKKIITALVMAGVIFLFGGCTKNVSPKDKQDFDENTLISEETEPTAQENEHSGIPEETQANDEGLHASLTLSSLIGKTVKEITDIFGTDYSVSDYNGGYFISYEDRPFSLFYRNPDDPDGIRSEVPAPTDVIFIVMSGGEGMVIFEDVEIGSRVATLEACIGETLDVEYDEMEDDYFVTFTRDGLRYVMSVDGESKITSCEVWDERT